MLIWQISEFEWEGSDAHLDMSPSLHLLHLTSSLFNALPYRRVFEGLPLIPVDLARMDHFLRTGRKIQIITNNYTISYYCSRLKEQFTHHVSEAVFPTSHVCNHIVLQAVHSTHFALVVWWDRFTGAAVLPHILKTCRRGVWSLVMPFNVGWKGRCKGKSPAYQWCTLWPPSTVCWEMAQSG